MQMTNQGDGRTPDPDDRRQSSAVLELETWWERRAEEFAMRFNSFVTTQSGRPSDSQQRSSQPHNWGQGD